MECAVYSITSKLAKESVLINDGINWRELGMKLSKIILQSVWLFALLSSYNCHALVNPSKDIKDSMLDLKREATFTQFIKSTINPFWESYAVPGRFVNRQGLTIHFVEVGNEHAEHTIVISPGRVEGYLKYKELAFDLVEQGYRVFIIDHQGQGLSSRLLVNRHKGHVKHFDDYASDFNQFMTEIVEPKVVGSVSIVAHSMGSAIALRYLQTHQHKVNKTVFSSPMWGLPTGPIPAQVLKPVVKSAAWLVELVQPQTPYFVGSMDYESVPFATNSLTHSEPRYQYFRETYEQNPDLKLGGITYSWVVASINALDKAYAQLDRVRIPVMVFQASEDGVIDNEAQNKFCQRLKDVGNECETGQPIVFDGARHEIFIERDAIRAKAIKQMLAFIKS